jgi:HEAT repeat protein
MLRPEEAEKRLKEFKVPDGKGNGKGKRLSRIAELPEALRAVAYPLLEHDANGLPIRGDVAKHKAGQEAKERLEALAPADREQVFEALFPRIGKYVERGWQLHARLPYQATYMRKAFRAPSAPGAVRQSRNIWLTGLLQTLQGYEQEITWLAAWAPYIASYWGHQFGLLFAGAIESSEPEGEEVLRILLASGRGEHEIGGMGRHVTGALLCASRPEGWEFVERLLLAAQRQEGLRQVILESVDETHPEAFKRMLRLILEHDLLRFSAAIRAVDVWFGFGLEVEGAPLAKKILTDVLQFLEDPVAREAALGSEDGETVFLALWAMAFEDAYAAVEPASRLLKDPKVERRFAAAYLLGEIALPESRLALIPALEDEDLRVAMAAFAAVRPVRYYGQMEPAEHEKDLFEPLERLVRRCPKKQTQLPQLLWPWMTITADQSQVATALVHCLGERSPKALIPYLPLMDGYGKGQAIELLSKIRGKDTEVRETLFAMVGDLDEFVRGKALEAVEKLKVEAAEAPPLEKLLTRKTGSLRRGVLSLLLNQKDEAALRSADRLLGAKHPLQRLAGLELLQQMTAAGRAAEAARARAEQYRSARPELTGEEEKLIEAFLHPEREKPTLDNALGLMDPAQRTPTERPQAVEDMVFESKAAQALMKALDDLIHHYRETTFTLQMWDDSERQELLGNITYGFPAPEPGLSREEDAARLPLREVWEEWWNTRPAETRDPDGFELLRAMVAFNKNKQGKLKHSEVVGGLMAWMLRLHPPAGVLDFLLDAAATQLAQIPDKELNRPLDPERPYERGWREVTNLPWLGFARAHRIYLPSDWTEAHHVRFWKLVHWIDEPVPGSRRERPPIEDILPAFRAGAATEADLIDLLLGPREEGMYSRSDFQPLYTLTARKGSPLFQQYPELREVVDRCRQRVVEVELGRGDMPTAATSAALALRYAGGLDVLIRLLQSFGKATLVRGWTYNDRDKAAVFSRLIRATFPEEGDTPEEFAEKARAAKIPQKRLIEVAFYAPQWAQHIEHTLGWPGFEEAVWWIHAHTKDERWSVDEEIREAWTAEVSERTPLAGQSLIDGAVDVAWFHRIHGLIGPERWGVLDDGAKYASGGGGHKRAQLYADAMLGRVTKEELVGRIQEKRNQDALRALGLLPLPEGKKREQDVLNRYKIVQEFLRTSRQFGSQRQASEKLAASISMENLARTAGYPDPVRLEWAMEAREIADLAAGPVTATAGDVTVTLSINEWGEADLTVTKKGKPVKEIPAAARKDPKVAELRERKTAVQRQASRMRLSLEQAMIRGDQFTGAELRELSGHPVLAPMLRNLVFLCEEGVQAFGRSGVQEDAPETERPYPLGYPIEGGRALEAHDGTTTPVGEEERLRLAHPYDLLQTGEWHLWQRDCFRRERIQPFKQVFRELYVLTQTEQVDGTRSHRYAGHQVAQKQAMALLGRRGWVSNLYEGDVRRTFHDQGLTVWLEFDHGWSTPAQVEGLTIESVQFSKRGEWKPLRLEEIPPRIFSEVMRDVDLVVSVAHQGGVDPEATASTVEMRSSLVRETCTLLNLENVRLQNSHALIDGELGTYSVHLGSAVVHRQPGGHLCIVPVHSQHRGRLFLPFADDDPKTAEVVSKVLLLARDQEIKDPTILEQILSVRS